MKKYIIFKKEKKKTSFNVEIFHCNNYSAEGRFQQLLGLGNREGYYEPMIITITLSCMSKKRNVMKKYDFSIIPIILHLNMLRVGSYNY